MRPQQENHLLVCSWNCDGTMRSTGGSEWGTDEWIG